MKTAKYDFFSKKYRRYIKAFFRRKPTEKMTNFAIITDYCGFGTFV